MYSMFEMANMSPFELQLAIAENKFDYQMESASNQYNLEEKFFVLLEAEQSPNAEKKSSGGGLTGLIKSFCNAIKSLFSSIKDAFLKAFGKTPDSNHQVKLDKDPKKYSQAVSKLNSDGMDLMQGVINGTKNEKDVQSYINGGKKLLSGIASVAGPAISIIGAIGIKDLTFGSVEKEVDEMLRNSASGTFEDSYKTLARLEHKDNYDAEKKKSIEEIMSFIQSTNKGFIGYLKESYARIYIGQQLDKHAQAVNDPNMRKDINAKEKEKADSLKQQRKELKKQVNGRGINEFLLNRRKNKTTDAASDLDRLKDRAYIDHERSTIERNTPGNKIKKAVDSLRFKNEK